MTRPLPSRRDCCRLALGALGGLALPHGAQALPPLRAVGGQFARIFEGMDGQAPRGLAMDLLAQLYGDQVRCQWVPWSRAQMMVEQGEADLLIGPYRTAEREARLRFSARSFYADTMVWYARRGETAYWNERSGMLVQQPVAAVRGWAYGARFEQLKSAGAPLTWVKNVESGLLMLERRRIDLFAGNDRNCRPVLDQLGLTDAIVRCSPPLDVMRGHMAFTRSAAGLAQAQRFDQLYERWLQNGSAATELYRRWGVDKPPAGG